MSLSPSERNPVNYYHVPKKQWKRWNTLGRHVFNKTMSYAAGNREIFSPPAVTKEQRLSDEEFYVLTWNFAWTAADIASRGADHIYE